MFSEYFIIFTKIHCKFHKYFLIQAIKAYWYTSLRCRLFFICLYHASNQSIVLSLEFRISLQNTIFIISEKITKNSYKIINSLYHFLDGETMLHIRCPNEQWNKISMQWTTLRNYCFNFQVYRRLNWFCLFANYA
jgi:hypothetical protein